MIKTFILLTLIVPCIPVHSQQTPDTIIVELANTSKVVFTMQDRSDIAILRQYDFQSMFNDMINQVDDSVSESQPGVAIPAEEDSSLPELENEDNKVHHLWGWRSSGRKRNTYHSVNFDFGVNNYLSNGKFPDADNALYSVRPWGSWYVGINSMQHTHVGGIFYLDWGLGISWYNFKFQKDNILVSKNEAGVIFSEDARDLNFIKSKLTASYLNATFVPMFDFGGHGSKARFWNSCDSGFRIGIGGYGGYRLGSHSKLVYESEDNEKEIERNNFYLNNLRYGIRLQVGFGSTDFFLNYDLNELFTSKPDNPELNAFSFGVTF